MLLRVEKQSKTFENIPHHKKKIKIEIYQNCNFLLSFLSVTVFLNDKNMVYCFRLCSNIFLN